MNLDILSANLERQARELEEQGALQASLAVNAIRLALLDTRLADSEQDIAKLRATMNASL